MKICIVNAHWSNRGDEAALRPILNELLNKYDDCEIQVIFKDSEDVKEFPYFGRVTHFSSKFLPHNLVQIIWGGVLAKSKIGVSCEMLAEIDAICKSDIIIYAPGGSVICDRFWWRKQLEYLLPFLCAKLYSIPIVVAAPSMGPFENKVWRNLIRKWLLSEAKQLCVREGISENYLRNIGVYKNVVTTIDTAFYDEPDEKKNRQILDENEKLKAFFEAYPKIIGMTLSNFLWHVEYSKEKQRLQNIEKSMKEFIKNRNDEGIGVLLIPQLFGNQNDEEYLMNFRYNNTFILSEVMDTYFQQFLISKLYAHVGMRYHSNIFAAKAGTPFIAIVYEEKMQGFMNDWDLNEYLIRLEELSINLLEYRWNTLVNDYGFIQTQLKKNREIWRDKAGETINTICRVIEKQLADEK